MYTKENPGCYHDMLRYMSEITGVSITKSVIVMDIKDLYYTTKSHNPKRKLKYKSRAIKVKQLDGGIVCFMQGSRRFDDVGIIAEHFIVEVNRMIEEFNVKFESCGWYKDCLGGGWTSKVPMYKVEEFYFASMDCSC